MAALTPSLRAAPLTAQERPDVTEADLRAVFHRARRFSEKRGAPPAYDAYVADQAGRDSLAGWVFRTPDVPPEAGGYSGPIDALVGLDLGGDLTGVRVLEYHESLKSSRGDFLATSGFQEQFTGKSIADAFRVRRDVDGVAGATITSSAVARGIRNAARRVAATRMAARASEGADAPTLATISSERLARMTFPELLAARMAIQLVEPDLTVSVVYVRDPEFGEALMGLPFRSFHDALGESVHERQMLLVGFDGPRASGPLPRIFLAQNGDTLTLVPADFMELKAITAGTLAGAFARPGLWLASRTIDPTLPFQVGMRRPGGAPPLVADYALEPSVPAAERRAESSTAPAAASAPPTPSAVAPPAPTEPRAEPTLSPAGTPMTAPTSAAREPRRPIGVFGVLFGTAMVLSMVGGVARWLRRRRLRASART